MKEIIIFFKKVFIQFLQVAMFAGVVYANSCPKWLPMPMMDGLHVIMPIYDESITGPDLDCDEIVDSVDTDIDGDGVSNVDENANGTNPLNPDSDGDGVSDGSDAFPLDASEATDTDGDGVGNNADTDDDNDYYSDVIEIATGTDPLDAISHPTPFRITVTTSNPGTSSDTSFTIPTYPAETYNYMLYCQDNTATVSQFSHSASGNYTCNYSIPGTYTISIYDKNGDGTGFPGIYFNNSGDKDKIVGINQWGTGKWKRMDRAFRECSNLGSVGGDATDVPNLSQVSSLELMFSGAHIFNQNIGNWDVSNVSNMNLLFSNAYNFNQDISGWDTSNVTNMRAMFLHASHFNQNIGGWDTSKVSNMYLMFRGAHDFNAPIGDWNTSKVHNMAYMFESASAFNQPIGDWDVSKVIHTYLMFKDAISFNQPIGDWDIHDVKNMSRMFEGAISFNQPIGDWNTSKVTDMNDTFHNAISFSNQDLSNWNVDKVNDRHAHFFHGAGMGNTEPKWPHFIITVKTDNFGTSADNQFTIPTISGQTYNYNVDCDNDGVDDNTSMTGDTTCVYPVAGTYTIVIKDNTGTKEGFPAIYFNNSGDKNKLLDIKQWGTGKWTTMIRAFYGCYNLNSDGKEAFDTPDLSNVQSLFAMFMETDYFNQNISTWDTSHITDMGSMFMNAVSFNQNISGWDTGNVIFMDNMFHDASSFTNHDLSGWDVSDVTNHDDFMTGAGAGNTEPLWF